MKILSKLILTCGIIKETKYTCAYILKFWQYAERVIALGFLFVSPSVRYVLRCVELLNFHHFVANHSSFLYTKRRSIDKVCIFHDISTHLGNNTRRPLLQDDVGGRYQNVKTLSGMLQQKIIEGSVMITRTLRHARLQSNHYHQHNISI